MAQSSKKTNNEADKKPECFVIMPISDRSEYPKGHFRKVYDWIFKPACEAAGYAPKLASDVKRTNLIHKDILTRLLKAPMVLCDLSNQNPNVMYELGIRQAFDKPVVLVKDMQTETVFDTGIFRYTEYAGLEYGAVVEAVSNIAQAIKSTTEAHKDGDDDVSLIKSLSINAANLQEVTRDDVVNEMASEIKHLQGQNRGIIKVLAKMQERKTATVPSLRDVFRLSMNSSECDWINNNISLAETATKRKNLFGRIDDFKDSPDEDV